MQRVKPIILCALISLAMCLSVGMSALTIDDIAVKNNRIIELDQEITIAEKNKKLAEIKNSSVQPETIALPRPTFTRREPDLAVIAVHGAPNSPVVDVQYQDTVLQKKRGDIMPDGWQLTAIGKDSVTFSKKRNRKPDLIKILGIGAALGGNTLSDRPVAEN
jgi:hypothetical protein